MAGVMQKLLVASMFMWILPVVILYGFNNDLLPGKLTSFVDVPVEIQLVVFRSGC